MKSRDERREDQRRYENDVFYEVWRNGGNPDRINDDLVVDAYYDDRRAEDAAREELRRQRPAPEPEEQQQEEPEPEEQQQEEQP